MAYSRKTNIFEKLLLIIGIMLLIAGYIVIHRMTIAEGRLSWELLQTTFLWLLMILLVILAAVSENMKEELKIVIQNQVDEIKLLRQDLKKKR